jgi:hypothetical protein
LSDEKDSEAGYGDERDSVFSDERAPEAESN